MDAATRTTFETWRAEIADAIAPAAATLAVAVEALHVAELAEAAEKTRVRNLAAAFRRLPNDTAVANALRSRLEVAQRVLATAGNPRSLATAVEAAQLRLDDLRAALDQIEAILRPPATPALHLVEAAEPAAAKRAVYDPIVMPGKALV